MTEPHTANKRFIAGAVCPACGAQDTVRRFSKKGRDVRECVDCDFSDEIQEAPALAGVVPATRISHAEDVHDNAPDHQEVQIVRMLDSP